jgi:hypothetical protein
MSSAVQSPGRFHDVTTDAEARARVDQLPESRDHSIILFGQMEV